MYGLVIYAGHDTKLVQNSGELEQAGWPSHFNYAFSLVFPGRTKFKRTRLDHLMNKMVIMVGVA